MKLFELKRPCWLGWRFLISLLLVIALLAFSVPWRRVWQRVKVPVLVQCFRHGPAATRRYAAIFLAFSDGDKKMIVSVLLPGLKDKDEGVREMTAIALGDIHQEPEQVVPALFACIYALGAIGHFSTNARPWSPILMGMIESNRFHYWLNPLGVLNSIDPEVVKPLLEKRDADYSNGVKQAQAHFDEVARRRALFLRTNVPPANSAALTNAPLADPHP